MPAMLTSFSFVNTFDPNFPDVLVPLGPTTEEELEAASEYHFETGCDPYPKMVKCPECGLYGRADEECERMCVSPEEYARVTATCEHGMSAWLCEGPMHYPSDM